MSRVLLPLVARAPPVHFPAMQKRSSKDQPKKNPAAVALGRMGGLKGGKARAAKLTAEQRREIALRAAEARWQKKNP